MNQIKFRLKNWWQQMCNMCFKSLWVVCYSWIFSKRSRVIIYVKKYSFMRFFSYLIIKPARPRPTRSDPTQPDPIHSSQDYNNKNKFRRALEKQTFVKYLLVDFFTEFKLLCLCLLFSYDRVVVVVVSGNDYWREIRTWKIFNNKKKFTIFRFKIF